MVERMKTLARRAGLSEERIQRALSEKKVLLTSFCLQVFVFHPHQSCQVPVDFTFIDLGPEERPYRKYGDPSKLLALTPTNRVWWGPRLFQVSCEANVTFAKNWLPTFALDVPTESEVKASSIKFI